VQRLYDGEVQNAAERRRGRSSESGCGRRRRLSTRRRSPRLGRPAVQVMGWCCSRRVDGSERPGVGQRTSRQSYNLLSLVILIHRARPRRYDR